MTHAEAVARFWAPLLPDHWVDLHADGTLWMAPAIPHGERAARPYRAHWRTLRAPHTPGPGCDREHSSGSDLLISASQAANILGVTPQRVYQLISEGRLPAWRIGADRVVCVRDLDAIRDRKRTGRPSRPA